MWNGNWYLQGGGGTTGVVLLSAGATLMEPLDAELHTAQLEAELVVNTLTSELVETLEAEVE